LAWHWAFGALEAATHPRGPGRRATQRSKRPQPIEGIRRTPIADAQETFQSTFGPDLASAHPSRRRLKHLRLHQRPEVVAFNPADAVMSLTTAQVLTMAREQGHNGIVINPAGPSIRISVAEIFGSASLR